MRFAKRQRRRLGRSVGRARETLRRVAPAWLTQGLRPVADGVDLLLVDHGIFRLFYANRHRLTASAWRSSQPTPREIKAFAKTGIRTIVNLRGGRHGGVYRLEKEACAQSGIRLVDFEVKSRAAPRRETVLGAQELFEALEHPILLHCKSGADRVGLMSALYLIFKEGRSVAEAKRQLNWRFGHVSSADTGVLDFFFQRYLDDCRLKPMAFDDWVQTVYDPEELQRSFHARSWANVIVNRVLRRE